MVYIHFCLFVCFNHYNNFRVVNSIIIPIWQLGKLSLREMKNLAQGQVVHKVQSRNQNSGPSDSKGNILRDSTHMSPKEEMLSKQLRAKKQTFSVLWMAVSLYLPTWSGEKLHCLLFLCIRKVNASHSSQFTEQVLWHGFNGNVLPCVPIYCWCDKDGIVRAAPN